MLLRLLTVAALAAVPAIAGASAIIDGSFEAAGAGIGDYCYDGLPYGSGPCPVGAWGTAGGVIRSGSGAWGGTAAADGDYYGLLQGGQVLTQTFVATATSGLTLNWADANGTTTAVPIATPSQSTARRLARTPAASAGLSPNRRQSLVSLQASPTPLRSTAFSTAIRPRSSTPSA